MWQNGKATTRDKSEHRFRPEQTEAGRRNIRSLPEHLQGKEKFINPGLAAEDALLEKQKKRAEQQARRLEELAKQEAKAAKERAKEDKAITLTQRKAMRADNTI